MRLTVWCKNKAICTPRSRPIDLRQRQRTRDRSLVLLPSTIVIALFSRVGGARTSLFGEEFGANLQAQKAVSIGLSSVCVCDLLTTRALRV